MPESRSPLSSPSTKRRVQWHPRPDDPQSVERQSLVVVANRLPVHRVPDSQQLRWATSPGGLVSALKSVLNGKELCWVGWSGDADRTHQQFRHDGIHNCPVTLTQDDLDGYYAGFSNRILWPLFHDAMRPPEYRRRWWKPYVEVNRRFAEATAEVLQENGTAWIHDYHLMLVPQMLREMVPSAKISYFLHIPFPPEELFAQLPWRKELLEGVLGADVIGFQTQLGAQNFSRLAQRYADACGSDGLLKVGDRVTKVDSFPISIDRQQFERLAADPAVQERVRELREQIGSHRKIFLGVDRLDYTKGIDVRLSAYRTLLEREPELCDKIAFVQVAVPSREKVQEYAEIRTTIEQEVGRINGAFGSPGQVPLHYLYQSLPIHELVAFYLAADVMVVTPFRDGMNLVAKEYVSTRLDNTGLLILSEFTGAAKELNQSLLVNPHDIDGLAATFRSALDMSPAEVQSRMSALRHVIQNHDVHQWADECLGLTRL